jgi:glycosyltransferase involved in cell wall biosynthesis
MEKIKNKEFRSQQVAGHFSGLEPGKDGRAEICGALPGSGDKIPEVSIAIPIYNEEKGVEKTVRNLVRVFENNKADYQLVLVNHGSWDDTESIINRLGKENNKLKIINLPKNLGYGGGIMHGLDNSDGKIIGFTCADEEVSAEDVYKIYDSLIKNPVDAAKTKRIKRKDGAFRKLTTFVFNTLIFMRFRLKIKDINGYPIFMKRELYPSVRAKEKTYLFNLDFLINMTKKNYRILEIPIIHQKRETGKSFMRLLRIVEMSMGLLYYSIKFRR